MTESDKKYQRKTLFPESWSTAKRVGVGCVGFGLAFLCVLLCFMFIASYITDKSSTPAVRKI